MFVTPESFSLGSNGFSVGQKKNIKHASGYPLHLMTAQAYTPISVAIYGAPGGVGDEDGGKYVIPLLFGSRTINVYSDIPLYEDDSLTITLHPFGCVRANTDLSSLQDRSQTWKLPKSNDLTVYTGTTIKPKSIIMHYYSSDSLWSIYGSAYGAGDITINLLDPAHITKSTKDNNGWYQIRGYTSPKGSYTTATSFLADVDLGPGQYLISLELYADGDIGRADALYLGLRYDDGTSYTNNKDFTADTNIFVPYGTMAYIGRRTHALNLNKHVSKLCLGCFQYNHYVLIRNIQIEAGNIQHAYEPFGYKIPMTIDGRALNVYSDALLFENEIITLDIDEHTASKGSSDLSGMQNWSQFYHSDAPALPSSDTAAKPDTILVA